MDVEALILLSHMKVRLERLTRNPELIHQMALPAAPKLPAPMEFAGLKSLLLRAKGLEARSGTVRPRVDAALNVIEQGVGILEGHAPELEKYGADLMSTINGMLEPTNGGPPLEGEAPPEAPTAEKLGPNGGPRILP